MPIKKKKVKAQDCPECGWAYVATYSNVVECDRCGLRVETISNHSAVEVWNRVSVKPKTK